jgi:hypothetical protein
LGAEGLPAPRIRSIETGKDDAVVNLANTVDVVEDLDIAYGLMVEDLDTASVIGVVVLGTVVVMFDYATSELGYKVGWSASVEMWLRAENN